MVVLVHMMIIYTVYRQGSAQYSRAVFSGTVPPIQILPPFSLQQPSAYYALVPVVVLLVVSKTGQATPSPPTSNRQLLLVRLPATVRDALPARCYSICRSAVRRSLNTKQTITACCLFPLLVPSYCTSTQPCTP